MKAFSYKYAGKDFAEFVELLTKNNKCPYCERLSKIVAQEGIKYVNCTSIILFKNEEALIKCRCNRFILDK